MSEHLLLRDHLLDILIKEMKLRKQRSLNEWIESERLAIFTAVNQWRAWRRKPSIDLMYILQVENSCVGHVDYAQKYALRCAELAVYRD